MPSLVIGDEKAQVTAAYGYTRISDDVGADSLWRRREANEWGETLKLEGVHIFRDRWQGGLSVPMVRRSRAEESSTGVGDISATLGYEWLPDWDYNPWRPRGVGFLRLTSPTGRSIHESEAMYQLDSRGRGFWAIGGGTVLSKAFGRWDGYSSIEVHRSFAKSYSSSQSSGRLLPGWGGELGLGAGYNLVNLRFGVGLSWTYEDAIHAQGGTASFGVAQRYATGTLSASYLFPREFAAIMTYADQRLFGSPLNTTLGQSVTIALQKRWLR